MGHTWESRKATIGGSESHRRDETGGSDQADWWTYPVPHMYCMQDIIVTAFAMNVHRGRSCAKALRAFAEKFGLGRIFLALTYAILSRY